MTKSKVVANIRKNNDKSVILSFSGTPKAISGHRFTALLGLESNMTETKLLFDFYGLRFQAETKVMILGNLLESSCIEYQYGDEIVLTYNFNDYNGNALDLNNEYDINGLPDGILPEKNTLIENKVTTRRYYCGCCREPWKKQAQFYAYWWNKLRAKDTGITIDNIEVLRYYVPEEQIDWQISNPNKIVGENIQVYKLPLDTSQIEKDIEFAKQKKEELMKRETKLSKRTTQMIRWLGIGSAKGLVKFKLEDENDPATKEVMNAITKERNDYLDENNKD